MRVLEFLFGLFFSLLLGLMLFLTTQARAEVRQPEGVRQSSGVRVPPSNHGFQSASANHAASSRSSGVSVKPSKSVDFEAVRRSEQSRLEREKASLPKRRH